MTETDVKEYPWHPLESTGSDRKHLAHYLNRVGRGVNCRLDVPVLCVEDVKWASKIFGDLSKELANIAFDEKRPDIWRILGARYAMEGAKRELHVRNNRKLAKKVFEDAVRNYKR